MRVVLSAALVLAIAAPALADPPVVIRKSNGQRRGKPVGQPQPAPHGRSTNGQPNGPRVIVRDRDHRDHRNNRNHHDHRDHRGGRVVVQPQPVPGRVVIRPNPTYRPPVVVRDRVVVRGPRVVYQPRVVERRWVYRPNVVVVRPYWYVPITPIYVPLVNTAYSTTLQQGELWPQNTEYMSYFTHYTLSIERNTVTNNYGGYLTQTFLNLYPQTICQDTVFGCSGVVTPPMSRLLVTSDTRDACGTRRIVASAYAGASPITHIELTDYSRYNCNYAGTYNELVASRIVHADGYEEFNLSGNISYYNW